MSNTPKDGGPAFPHQVRVYKQYDDGSMMTSPVTRGGMTLRDYFAAAAMQGWIAAAPLLDGKPLAGTRDHAENLAAVAYGYADAMLAERAKQGRCQVSNTPQCDVLEELSLAYCDDKCVKEWKLLAYKLEADNAALRAALERIIDDDPLPPGKAAAQARAALGKEAKP